MEYEDMNMALIRVGDGYNLIHSLHSFWSIRSGKGNKKKLSQFQPGVQIAFIGSKQSKNQYVLGFATLVSVVDIRDEPLIHVNTKSNEEQNWRVDDPDEYPIQIHYKDYYAADSVGIPKIPCCINNPNTVIPYNKYMEKIPEDLYYHHEQFKRYGTPKVFMS
jgi:hypothetical protein